MKQLLAATLVLAVLGMATLAQATDKPDPTGTWKWSMKFRDQSRDVTLKLKLEGDKLTGSMPGRDGKETAIEDGAYKNGEVSFKVVRERDGRKMTRSYKGTVSGDTIKGKVEFDRDGKPQSQDWEAKRAK